MRTSSSSSEAENGLVRKAAAPEARAARRDAADANEVTTMTGTGGWMALAARMMSRPSPSGSRRSEITRRGGFGDEPQSLRPRASRDHPIALPPQQAIIGVPQIRLVVDDEDAIHPSSAHRESGAGRTLIPRRSR